MQNQKPSKEELRKLFKSMQERDYSKEEMLKLLKSCQQGRSVPPQSAKEKLLGKLDDLLYKLGDSFDAFFGLYMCILLLIEVLGLFLIDSPICTYLLVASLVLLAFSFVWEDLYQCDILVKLQVVTLVPLLLYFFLGWFFPRLTLVLLLVVTLFVFFRGLLSRAMRGHN
ncbi:MAG: hypothetical protein J6Y37_02330 [Paludibacteraceae bacterium]|nr:hypothetical protein [Paludibacteraceae bacterium]MBP5455313.1 hypothetical protein [Paludibacteraceae bacterium]MBR4840179.1 hypothetical protein [Paludibacteraceae bacterium]